MLDATSPYCSCRWGPRLTAYAVGYSMYVIQDPDGTARPNRVNMIFRDQGGPDCACTCAFPARFKIPCRHLFAAAKGGNFLTHMAVCIISFLAASVWPEVTWT